VTTPANHLWDQLAAWSDNNGTEGFIPVRIAYMLGTRDACLMLVDSGRCEDIWDGCGAECHNGWHHHRNGYRLIGYQPGPHAVPAGTGPHCVHEVIRAAETALHWAEYECWRQQRPQP
jgi:hypothetical protein